MTSRPIVTSMVPPQKRAVLSDFEALCDNVNMESGMDCLENGGPTGKKRRKWCFYPLL